MIGQRILNYRIESLIDEGGMGTVYLGIHLHLGRKVAIKSLNTSFLKNQEIKERFKNEAITISKLQHPNIVTLYDYVERPDGIFLIMEYVDGHPLDTYIEKISGPLPESKAISFFLKILDAVGYIHRYNIIHRDIKPANFVVTSDLQIKLLDFGIAKPFQKEHLLTKTGTKVGTALYMSPQQVKGQLLDRRTDIYSLAITLFQMLTGKYPYDTSASEHDIFQKILNDSLPQLRLFVPAASERIQNIINKATEKKPIDRFQSCEEFALALTGNTQHESSGFKFGNKLLDLAEFKIKSPLLSKSFLRTIILTILAALFVTGIVVVIINLQNSDVRQVLSEKAALHQTDSIGAETIEYLNYGETVKVLNANGVIGNINDKWVRVISLRGNTGYISGEELAKPKIFEQINSPYGNNTAQQLVPVKYKWALRKYFIDNHLIKSQKTDWKIFSQPQNALSYNTIVEGDFNNNGRSDFVCVIRNIELNKSKLLVLFDSKDEFWTIDFDDNIKIRKVPKGDQSGAWYIGNKELSSSTQKKEDAIKKYEPLTQEGILLLKTVTQENILYLFNKEQNRMLGFVQPQ